MNFLRSNKKGSEPIHRRRGKLVPMSHQLRLRQELKIRHEGSPKHQLPKINTLDSTELTQYMSCGGIKLTTRLNLSLHPRKKQKPSSPPQNPQASTAPSRPFLPSRALPPSCQFLLANPKPPQSQFPLRHFRVQQNPQERKYMHRLPEIAKEDLTQTRHRKKHPYAFYAPLRLYVTLEPCQQKTSFPSPHPHVLLPLGTINLRQKSWQISDRYYYISLQNMLSEFGRVSNKLTRRYIRQLVGALVHLHGEGFTHNRLNMENVTHDGEGRVFIDWLTSSEDPLSDQERLKHFYYFPPEVLLSPNYHRSQKNDVWALGCLILQLQMEDSLLYSPLHPYNRSTEGYMSESTHTLKKVQQLMTALGISSRPAEQQQLTVLCMEFVSLCLAVNLERRASLAQLLRHPFLAA